MQVIQQDQLRRLFSSELVDVLAVIMHIAAVSQAEQGIGEVYIMQKYMMLAAPPS